MAWTRRKIYVAEWDLVEHSKPDFNKFITEKIKIIKSYCPFTRTLSLTVSQHCIPTYFATAHWQVMHINIVCACIQSNKTIASIYTLLTYMPSASPQMVYISANSLINMPAYSPPLPSPPPPRIIQIHVYCTCLRQASLRGTDGTQTHDSTSRGCIIDAGQYKANYGPSMACGHVTHAQTHRHTHTHIHGVCTGADHTDSSYVCWVWGLQWREDRQPTVGWSNCTRAAEMLIMHLLKLPWLKNAYVNFSTLEKNYSEICK